MMKKKLLKALFSFFLALTTGETCFSLVPAKEKTYTITNFLEVIIDSSINPATYSHLKSAYKKIQSKEGAALLIKINTPGGLVSTTKKILNLMGTSKAPTIIWVAPESASATSAGALIASGAHFLFMSSGTNIGAATPINMNAKDLGDDLRSKAINDLVALISSLSQTRGRNPELFAKMVQDAASYTAKEAKAKNIIDGIANSTEEIYKQIAGKKFQLKGETYRVLLDKPKTEVLPMDLGQKILNIFADPNMAYILFILGAALIYLEFQAPGSFIPGSIGALLLLLSGISFQVLPLNLGALGLLVLAFILFVAEVYVLSYGALSVAGLCSLAFGSLFLFRTEDSYLTVSHHLILASTVAIAFFLLFLGIFLYRDSRGRKRNENFYSKSNRTAFISEDLGFNEQLGQYRYVIKVDGEIWSAYSDKKLEKGSVAKILKRHKRNMSFKIE